MKKRGLLVLCAWILALMAIATVAYAENDPVTCTIELSPEYLAGPGEVNVTITIANTTDQDLQDPLTLFSPQAEVVADFGNAGSAILKAGESQTWTGTYSVNERELEQGFIQYFAKYTVYKDNGQASPSSQAIRATIGRQEAEVAIDVERTITPSAAREGQEIQVKYTITNAGTVALTDLSITENKDINSKTQNIPRLDPGAKVDLTYKPTMKKENLTSSAVITYKAEGSKKEEKYTVDEKTIPFAQTNLTATLSSDVKGVVSGGTLTLKLELKNKGSSDLSDIRVTDAVLGDVFTNQTLEAGKTLELEKEITLTESSEHQFVINAIDSTGTEVSVTTDALPLVAMNPEDALNLTLSAVPDRTEVYDEPAAVRFTLTITNDSRVDATDVKISHGYMDLYTFDSIKAGESRTMSRDTVLSTTGKYQFTATAKDPLENESSFQSNEMQIAIYEPTPVPATPTPPPVPTPEPTFVPATWAPIHHESVGTIPKAIQKVLLPALIVAGILLLGSFILLMVAAKKRHDNKKASEAAFDHLERARRRDYTIVNPEEMAAASKATLSQNKPKDDADLQLYDDVGGDWDLPPIESLSPAPSEEPEQESYSSFGQGFIGEIGEDGFEGVQPMQTEDYDFEQQPDPSPEAAQTEGFDTPDAIDQEPVTDFSGEQSDDQPLQTEQPETFGDDRIGENAQSGLDDPFAQYEPYGDVQAGDEAQASYDGQTGYDAQGSYDGQYAQYETYGNDQTGYDAQATYEAQTGYDAQGSYDDQYAQYETYGSDQTGYDVQGTYEAQNGYDGQYAQYETYGSDQTGYDAQGTYDAQNGYDAQGSYDGQGGYDSQYAQYETYGSDQTGYDAQATYEAQTGYDAQGSYDGKYAQYETYAYDDQTGYDTQYSQQEAGEQPFTYDGYEPLPQQPADYGASQPDPYQNGEVPRSRRSRK